jgi:hypothetical protein
LRHDMAGARLRQDMEGDRTKTGYGRRQDKDRIWRETGSFHRLSILERVTDHKCNNNCNRPKEMWVGFKCNGLIVFSQRGGASKYTTHAFPAFPPSPPRLPHLLSLVPSPPLPPPQLRCCWARHLWLWCSGRGVLSREG